MTLLKLPFASLSILLLVHSIESEAQQPKGYIQNDNGDRCWYTQVVSRQIKYFHDSLVGDVYRLSFDDKGCMSDSGSGLDVNKMMINNSISKSYSHEDADFQTRTTELYPHTGFAELKRGFCIQSAKYPIVGVTVDYTIENGSIVNIAHGMAAGGCKR